ncbi:MAG: hypothetical protein KGR48_02975 [Alphaproteobacteria bacterium]|nr:hypothetical protein [Alphaproteobacteria bacterium]MBU6471555.1 hypothetical protein [Alphaproteobacteria bacterium]MDE2013715.1 hypothetical protein [Alphaproteobacteria bacterium]MDE2074715.1 hypothetical protein [Alphaproteobacteria bacterium]
MRMTTPVHPRDMLAKFPLVVAIFWVPILAIAITGYVPVGGAVRTAVWTAGCLLMSTACFINAMRCGRLHCYLTGPLFLLGGLASLFYGLGLLPLGKPGWGIIGYTLLAGVVLLTYLPERFLGRYR